MGTQSYQALVSLASGYVDRSKVVEVLSRQLATCKLDANTLSSTEVRGAASRLSTVFSLYITDEGKRTELKNKLNTF